MNLGNNSNKPITFYPVAAKCKYLPANSPIPLHSESLPAEATLDHSRKFLALRFKGKTFTLAISPDGYLVGFRDGGDKAGHRQPQNGATADLIILTSGDSPALGIERRFQDEQSLQRSFYPAPAPAAELTGSIYPDPHGYPEFLQSQKEKQRKELYASPYLPISFAPSPHSVCPARTSPRSIGSFHP